MFVHKTAVFQFDTWLNISFPMQVLDEDVIVWRTGIWRTCTKYLKARQKMLPVVKRLFFASRFLPSAPFSAFWGHSFEHLQSQGEGQLVEVLRRHYFTYCDGQWSSDWNGSPDRLGLATFCGSQPQESWHRHRLRPTLANLYLPVNSVVHRISSLLSSRCQQKDVSAERLLSVPSGHWSKRCAEEAKFYLQHKHFLCAKSGTSWAMRVECDSQSFEKLKTPVYVDCGNSPHNLSDRPAGALSAGHVHASWMLADLNLRATCGDSEQVLPGAM